MQESGLSRSTYVFQDETAANTLDASYASVTPVGLLVNVFQKGLQYMEIESTLAPNGDQLSTPAEFDLFSSAGVKRIERRPEIEDTAESANPSVITNATTTATASPEPSLSVTAESLPADSQKEKPSGDLEMRDSPPPLLLQNVKVSDEPAADKLSVEPSAVTSSRLTVRKHSMEDDNPPKSTEIDSDEDKKRVKTSHVRTMSTATTNLFHQPPASEPSAILTAAVASSLSNNAIPKPERQPQNPVYLSGVSSAIDSIWSADGLRMAVSTSSSTMFLYTFSEKSPEPTSQAQIKLEAAEEISGAALSSNMLAVGTYSGKIQLWDTSDTNTSLKKVLHGLYDAPILSLEFVTIEEKLYLVAIDCLRNAAMWCCSETETPISFFVSGDTSNDPVEGDKNSISDLKILPATMSVATTTGKKGAIDVFGLGAALKGHEVSPNYSLIGHSNVVNVLRYSAKSINSPELLVSGSQDHSIRVWDLSTRSEKYVLEGHHTGVIALKVSESDPEKSRILVSGDLAGRLRVWDLSNGSMLARIEYSYPVFAFDVVRLPVKESNGDSSSGGSNQRMRVITGSKDGVVNAWELSNNGGSHKILAQSIYGGLGGVTAVSTSSIKGKGDTRLAVMARGKSCIIYYKG